MKKKERIAKLEAALIAQKRRSKHLEQLVREANNRTAHALEERDRALKDFNNEMACNRRTREILEVPDHADIHIWAEGRMRQLRQKFLIGKGAHAEPS